MRGSYQLYSKRQVAANYLHSLVRLMQKVDLDAVERVAKHLELACENECTVYIAGNGGSAATATHLANDLGKGTKQAGRIPMRVMSLSDNASWLTALANDEGYERIFAGQLENFVRPGDVLVVISASGNSENLVKAVQLAKRHGVLTIALVGFDGGVLKEMVDEFIWIPTEHGSYELAEDVHSVLCHVLTVCLKHDGRTESKEYVVEVENGAFES